MGMHQWVKEMRVCCQKLSNSWKYWSCGYLFVTIFNLAKHVIWSRSCLPCGLLRRCTTSLPSPPPKCPGYYCPPGSCSGTDNPCPVGTWSNYTGLQDVSECVTCPGGYYCDQPALTNYYKLCTAGWVLSEDVNSIWHIDLIIITGRCMQTCYINTDLIIIGYSRFDNNWIYGSLSNLQPSISRPPLFIRPLDLVLKSNFLC